MREGRNIPLWTEVSMSSTTGAVPTSADIGALMAEIDADQARQANWTSEERAVAARYYEALNLELEERTAQERARGWDPIEPVDFADEWRDASRAAGRVAMAEATERNRTERKSRQLTRSRQSHRTRPGQRNTRRNSAARSSDDDSGPSSEPPPPLPCRIAGPVGDDSAVQAAFLSILSRKHHGTHWEVRP
jgi:hypothetical protein